MKFEFLGFELGTPNAQARSVWTSGMKIHFGSLKFSGKVASWCQASPSSPMAALGALAALSALAALACLKCFLPCLNRIATYNRRNRRLQYWRYLPWIHIKSTNSTESTVLYDFTTSSAVARLRWSLCLKPFRLRWTWVNIQKHK